MNELELIRDIKRDLVRKRLEIDKMKSGKRKTEAMKIYAELLTTLEMDDPAKLLITC